jgi:hypothetical protein
MVTYVYCFYLWISTCSCLFFVDGSSYATCMVPNTHRTHASIVETRPIDLYVILLFLSFFPSVFDHTVCTYRWIFWDSLPWQLMVTCLLFLSGFFFLFLLFSFLMVVLTPHACWFLFHRVHASCDSFLFDFFSSVLTIQFAYLDGSLGSITWETDGYLCLLFLSGTRFFFVLMV